MTKATSHHAQDVPLPPDTPVLVPEADGVCARAAPLVAVPSVDGALALLVGVPEVVAEGPGAPDPAAVAVNEKVPDTGCPSADVTRQVTVYRPAGEPVAMACRTVASTSRGLPRCTGPSGPLTSSWVPTARAGWSNVSTTSSGGVGTVAPSAGDVDTRAS